VQRRARHRSRALDGRARCGGRARGDTPAPRAGKTTFIKHLLGREYPGIHIGPEPTTDRFVIVDHALEERRTPGNTLIVQPDKPYQARTARPRPRRRAAASAAGACLGAARAAGRAAGPAQPCTCSAGVRYDLSHSSHAQASGEARLASHHPRYPRRARNGPCEAPLGRALGRREMRALRAPQGLAQYGNGFLAKFEAASCPNRLLEEISLVDTPGVLSGEKQRIERTYNFIDVCGWFAARCDLILLLFDPHKLDVRAAASLAVSGGPVWPHSPTSGAPGMSLLRTPERRLRRHERSLV